MTAANRLNRSIRFGVVTALALLSSAVAHAELFPDNEARKAIVELRDQAAANKKETAERFDRLSHQIDQATDQTARSQIDLAQQIEALRREIAALRGALEVSQKDIADLQKRQREVYADIDARLKKQEPQKVTIEGKEYLVDPEQIKAYNAAFELFRASQFAPAVNSLSSFLALYPQSAYAPLAQFWMGNAQYATRDFKNAIATQQSFLKAHPENPHAPEASFTIGNCQLELNDKKAARATFRSIIDAYPGTGAAQNAKDRLATIK